VISLCLPDPFAAVFTTSALILILLKENSGEFSRAFFCLRRVYANALCSYRSFSEVFTFVSFHLPNSIEGTRDTVPFYLKLQALTLFNLFA
jgi:hypothetical protein